MERPSLSQDFRVIRLSMGSVAGAGHFLTSLVENCSYFSHHLVVTHDRPRSTPRGARDRRAPGAKQFSSRGRRENPAAVFPAVRDRAPRGRASQLRLPPGSDFLEFDSPETLRIRADSAQGSHDLIEFGISVELKK